MKLFICLALVAAAAAASYHDNNQHSYQGHFYGKCGNDGIYYNDESSFMFCSNGNAYHQPSAPGSRNRGPHSFNQGGNYGFKDFCGINLVSHNYAAQGYGHQSHSPQSAHNSYHDNNGYGYSNGFKKTVTYEKKGYQDNGYDSNSHDNEYKTLQQATGYNTQQQATGYNTHQHGYNYDTPQHSTGYGHQSQNKGYVNDLQSQGYDHQVPHGNVETKTVVKKTYSTSAKH